MSLLRVSIDEIRKLLKENGYGYESVKNSIYSLAEEYITKGFSISVDGDCNSKEAQERIKELKEKYQIKVYWIHIDPPEEFIIKKLKNYKHTWLFKNTESAIENYKNSKARHEDLNFSFIYTFDTSRNDLNEQINDCAYIIKNDTLK